MENIPLNVDGKGYVKKVRCSGCEEGGVIRIEGGRSIEVKVLINGGVSKPVSCKYLAGNREDMCKKFSTNQNEWGYCRHVKML